MAARGRKKNDRYRERNQMETIEMMKTLELLTASFGPSGAEEDIRETIKNLAEPLCDEITADALGNLICHKKGSGKKVMFAAHMDSVGFIVTHIEKDGLLRVSPVGGVYSAESIGVPVRFKSGAKGVIYIDDREKEEKPEFHRLYIDIGASDPEEAGKYVMTGDMAVYDTRAFLTPTGMLVTPYADDRAGCLILLQVMEQVKDSPNDLYFVFTAQEEIGLWGAKTSSYGIEPDIGIAVDVGYAGNGKEKELIGTCAVGKGAGIGIMDSRSVYNPRIVALMKELAARDEILWQADVEPGSCNDASAIIVSGRGTAAGAVTLPCRASHCSLEMVSPEDMDSCIRLCRALAEHEFA